MALTVSITFSALSGMPFRPSRTSLAPWGEEEAEAADRSSLASFYGTKSEQGVYEKTITVVLRQAYAESRFQIYNMCNRNCL